MNWFYAENGAQRGPVDDAQLDQLVAAGTVAPTTLVWCEGMAVWKPYHEARPVAGAAPVSGGLLCAGCGAVFAEDEVVRVEGRWVCVGCKPRILQQMMEGVAFPGGEGEGRRSEADLLQGDYAVDVGGCLNRSIEMFKADPWTIIGASVLAYLVLMAGAIIPFIGAIVQLVVQGAVMGGMWNFYVRKVRGRPAGIGDAFAGFGPRFGQLLLATLIPGLVVGVVAAVVVVPFVIAGISYVHAGGGTPGALPTGFIVVASVGGLVLFCAMVALQLLWLFAPALVIDKGYGFWPALEMSRKMVLKHFWGTLGLCIVAWLVGVLGMLACGIGLLVTGPVAFGMLAQHYERVFGELTRRS